MDDRIVFNFTDGKVCQRDTFKRTRDSVLTLYCDSSAADDSKPVFVQEREDCTYKFYWPRRELCNKPSVSIKLPMHCGQWVHIRSNKL